MNGQHDELRIKLGVNLHDGVAQTLKRKRDEQLELGLDDLAAMDDSLDEDDEEDESDVASEGYDEAAHDVNKPPPTALDAEDYLKQLETQALVASKNGLQNEYDAKMKRLSFGGRKAPAPSLAPEPSASAVASPRGYNRKPSASGMAQVAVAAMPRTDHDEFRTKPPLTWKPRHAGDWVDSLSPTYAPAAVYIRKNNIPGALLIQDSKLDCLKKHVPKKIIKELRTQVKLLKAQTSDGRQPCKSTWHPWSACFPCLLACFLVALSAHSWVL